MEYNIFQKALALFTQAGWTVDHLHIFNQKEGSGSVVKPTLGSESVVVPGGSRFQERSINVTTDMSSLHTFDNPVYAPLDKPEGQANTAYVFIMAGTESDVFISAGDSSKYPLVRSDTGGYVSGTGHINNTGAYILGQRCRAFNYANFYRDMNIGGYYRNPYTANHQEARRVGVKHSNVLGILSLSNKNDDAAVFRESCEVLQDYLNPKHYTGASHFSSLKLLSPTWYMTFSVDNLETVQEIFVPDVDILHSEGDIAVPTTYSEPVKTVTLDNDDVQIRTYINYQNDAGSLDINIDVNNGQSLVVVKVAPNDATVNFINITATNNTGSAILVGLASPLPTGTKDIRDLTVALTRSGTDLTVGVSAQGVETKKITFTIPALTKLTGLGTNFSRSDTTSNSTIFARPLSVWRKVSLITSVTSNVVNSILPALETGSATGLPTSPSYTISSQAITNHLWSEPPQRGMSVFETLSQIYTGCSDMGIATGPFTVVMMITVQKKDNVNTANIFDWNGTSLSLDNAPLFFIKGTTDGGIVISLSANDELLIHLKASAGTDMVTIPAGDYPVGVFFPLIIKRNDAGLVSVNVNGQYPVAPSSMPHDMGLASATTEVQMASNITQQQHGASSDIAVYDKAFTDFEEARTVELLGGTINTATSLAGTYENHTTGKVAVFRKDTGEFLISGDIVSGSFSLIPSNSGALHVITFEDTDTLAAGSLVDYPNGDPLPTPSFTAPTPTSGTHSVGGTTFDAGVFVSATVRVYRQDTFEMLCETVSDATTGTYLAYFDYGGTVISVTEIVGKLSVVPNIIPTVV